MFQTFARPRALSRAAGAVGGLALVALGSTPALADEPSPGVVLGATAPIDAAKPGSTFQVPTSFTNTGTGPLNKVWLTYTLSHGLSHTGLAELPSNCKHLKIPSGDGMPDSTEAICEFDQTVKPGVVYAPDKQLTMNVLDSALYDNVQVAVETSGFPYPGDNFSPPVPGTAPAVKLVEQPGATPAPPGSSKHGDWDRADVPVTAVNTADFQVSGARLKGGVGDVVPLTVGFTNAGPAWVQRRDRAEAVGITVRMPAGTTVTKSDPYCAKAGSGTYRCGTDFPWIKEGYVRNYTFQLKIDKSVTGAQGSIGLTGRSRPFDTNADNDTADIRLDVAGGEGTSGGGASPAPSTVATTPSGGDLADTGSGTALPLAGAAATAVALGAGAFLAARRRTSRR